ncbi:MAG: hypothetical protein V8S26_11110 [Lachnospiraceae bacterium]
MFRSYYEDYLTAAFNADFLYSDTITNIDDEKAFVDQAKEAGCEGIISYVSYDLPEITAYCADDMYYAIASGTFTEDEFAQASQHEKFLGITGPSEEDEYTAGKNLIAALAKDGDDLSATQKTWLMQRRFRFRQLHAFTATGRCSGRAAEPWDVNRLS